MSQDRSGRDRSRDDSLTLPIAGARRESPRPSSRQSSRLPRPPGSESEPGSRSASPLSNLPSTRLTLQQRGHRGSLFKEELEENMPQAQAGQGRGQADSPTLAGGEPRGRPLEISESGRRPGAVGLRERTVTPSGFGLQPLENLLSRGRPVTPAPSDSRDSSNQTLRSRAARVADDDEELEPTSPVRGRRGSFESVWSLPSFFSDESEEDTRIELEPRPNDLESLKWMRRKCATWLANSFYGPLRVGLMCTQNKTNLLMLIQEMGVNPKSDGSINSVKTSVQELEKLAKMLVDEFREDRTVQWYDRSNVIGFETLVFTDAVEMTESLVEGETGRARQDLQNKYLDKMLREWNPKFKSEPLHPEELKKRKRVHEAQLLAKHYTDVRQKERISELERERFSKDRAGQTIKQMADLISFIQHRKDEEEYQELIRENRRLLIEEERKRGGPA